MPPNQTRSSEGSLKAQAYYDSAAADEFYFQIWGGEDIHVGIYDHPNEPIREASHRTVQTLAQALPSLPPTAQVLDIGAGYGGAARFLASKLGLHVTCLNISETQNQRNRQKNAAQQLAHRVAVVPGNFEALPFADASFDVVWSQDALLHSGNKPQVLAEVDRVLRPGGHFIFTDPMQADDCPKGVLQPVLDRIHLTELGSVERYTELASELGWGNVSYHALTDHLQQHYEAVRHNLEARYQEIVQLTDAGYVDRMLAGLGHWITAAQAGYLAWGILHFQKPTS